MSKTSKAVTDAFAGNDEDLAQALKAFTDAAQAEETEEPEAPAEADSETPGSSEGDGAEAETKDESATESEATSTDEGTEDEVPNEYFGIDLSDLPPESRTKIIDGYKERDRIIAKSMQSKATEGEADKPVDKPPAAEPEAPKPLTDEDLMRALGYDPEDPMYEVKTEVALPLAKQVLQLNSKVQALVEQSEIKQLENYWLTTLDKMEADYGKLPYSREDVLDFAVENNVLDPVDAYNRLAAPGQKAIRDAAQAARTEALRIAKQQATTTRPRSTTATAGKAIEAKSLKDAVRQAAKQATEEAGFSWDEALAEQGLPVS